MKCNHPLGWKTNKKFRHYFSIDKSGEGKCPKCKSVYDIEILGSKKCPRCKIALKPRWEIWSEIECIICGETQIYHGVLRKK